MESNASRISPGPKNRPHRPPRPQGNPPAINGVAIPPRHQLPQLPYITDSLFSKFCLQSFRVSKFKASTSLGFKSEGFKCTCHSEAFADAPEKSRFLAARGMPQSVLDITTSASQRFTVQTFKTLISIRPVVNYIYRYNDCQSPHLPCRQSFTIR